ncbi:SDR family oxidoreductase [bacterium]|nr:SDR family oxidoreductase [bacterium]
MNESIFSLKGKTALVTGAGTGVGASLAMTLSKAGAKVALAARRVEKLKETEEKISESGGIAKSFSLDVSSEKNVQDCLDSISKEIDEIDILVNNAGTTTVASIDGTTSEDWDTVINTNLRGPWYLAKEWVKRRRSNDLSGGNVLNISSITGEAVQKGNGVYCVSKAGLSHLTRQMALEWAKYGIRVNSLAPGYMRTDINKEFIDSDISNDMIKRIPMRRVGSIDEMDGALLLLVSDAGSYITGSTLIVDGGHLLRDL